VYYIVSELPHEYINLFDFGNVSAFTIRGKLKLMSGGQEGVYIKSMSLVKGDLLKAWFKFRKNISLKSVKTEEVYIFPLGLLTLLEKRNLIRKLDESETAGIEFGII